MSSESQTLELYKFHYNSQATIISFKICSSLHRTQMTKHFSVTSAMLKVTVYLLLLSISLRCANSARVLSEEDDDEEEDDGIENGPIDGEIDDEIPDAAAIAPAASIPTVVGAATTNPAAVAATAKDDHGHPSLAFFMHDIVGGSTPTRMETGVIANSRAFQINEGLPLLNANYVPPITGLENANTNSSTLIQNDTKNTVVGDANRFPFVFGAQLPAGSTLQKLMFGSMTVINNELREGHERDSSVVGKVQGFYLATSRDGKSQTTAFTALLHGNGDEADRDFDTISFFGIRRTAAPLSQMTIVGGTGKYEKAKGYSTIENIRQVDQRKADGVETVLKLSIFLTS